MNIEHALRVIWRQKALVATVLVIGLLVFGFACMMSRKYTATATILAVSSSSQEAGVLDPSKDPTQSAIALADIPNLLSSSVLASQVGHELHLSADQTQRLQKSIKAKPSLGSDVLPVTITDTEPQRAVAEANSVVKQLQKFEQQIAMSRYDLLITDVKRQLNDRRAALGAIDRSIDALTTSDPYVTYSTGTESISTRLVALQTQRDQLQATMLGDASASNMMAKRPDLTRSLASQEIIGGDPVFQSLRSQYGKDLAQLNNQRAGYTDAFPGMSGLRGEVERESRSLADAEERATSNPAKSATYVTATLDQNKAQAALASDKAQLAAVTHEIDAMQAHLVSSRAENVSLASLHRDREAGDQAYAKLADRLAVAEGDRAQAASINSIVLLDRATTAAPALLSQPPLIAAAVSVIFLWLAITLAFIADGADSRLRTRTTIEELYGTPVFTSVG